MDAQIIAQRDFSAGQLDETALRRDDTDIMRAGLKRARNVRILNSGAIERRPGRRALFKTTGIAEFIIPASGEKWIMVFEPGAAIFKKADLSTTVRFSGLPWTADQLEEMTWEQSGSNIFVCHQAFRMRTFAYAPETGVWTGGAFQFATDPSGAIRQPFYNFYRGTGITMGCTARTGSNQIIEFSKPVLNAKHKGVHFRYAERQIRIDEVWSATKARVTIIEQLPPTFNVTLDNVEGVQVGDVVEGVTSNAKGTVVAIGGVTPVILTTKNWKGFEVNEVVVGPRSKGKVTATLEVLPYPTLLWEEALMSDYRGWPGCVSKDSQRLIFARYPSLGSAITWSALGTLNDFKVGADKEDAIFELVPDNCTVLDVIGGADEFVFTDQAVYYVPVSTTSPIIPGSIEFRKVSSDGAAPIRPRETADGLVFVNAARTRVMALIGTGQTAKPYLVDDLTEYHASLVKSPVAIATTTSDAAAPERYLYTANEDGTLAVARYQKQAGSRGWVGWVPWDGLGAVKWISANGPDIAVVAEYDTGAGPLRFVEVFDNSLLLDASTALASVKGQDPLELDPGVLLELSASNPLVLDATYAFNWAAGVSVSVEQLGWYRGDYTVQPDGSLSDDIPVSSVMDLVGGFNFTVEVEPFVPHADGGLSKKQRLRKRRIKQYAATVLHSNAIDVGARHVPYWNAGENQEQPPPLRSETYRGRMLGRDFDPSWSVRQTLPGRLTLTELTTEVTL